ncbi:hypothetical protein N8289_00640 [Flavobacteriales bacterium]|jgi:hypothetical protein|nr:hypothetical protein [Flavobacteriales bacterium]MDB9931256.1 hypothetical protein [Flavobacteriales bacterium]MDC1370324.1 hypothetical protein [Flavobacteriales bacterium]
MRNLLIASFLILLTISVTGCRKEKETTATIIVVNAAGEAVPNVFVRVYCPDATCNKSGSTLDESMDRNDETGSNGKAKFNYTEAYKLGQAGFAVLDVEVFLTEAALDARILNPSGATPEASGVVKIEEEVENEQTIVCQTCP